MATRYFLPHTSLVTRSSALPSAGQGLFLQDAIPPLHTALIPFGGTPHVFKTIEEGHRWTERLRKSKSSSSFKSRDRYLIATPSQLVYINGYVEEPTLCAHVNTHNDRQQNNASFYSLTADEYTLLTPAEIAIIQHYPFTTGLLALRHLIVLQVDGPLSAGDELFADYGYTPRHKRNIDPKTDDFYKCIKRPKSHYTPAQRLTQQRASMLRLNTTRASKSASKKS